MEDVTRVVSLYEGFFAGGARILHSDVVAGLHGSGTQRHSVLSIASRARRESVLQRMEDDLRYQRLVAQGVGVRTLSRTAGDRPLEPASYSPEELDAAAAALRDADLILSLKEQPLGLLLALHGHGLMPDVPVAVCLHRSDPLHSGPALGWLRSATDAGLVTATISCAETTRRAYRRAGAGAPAQHVVANGIDTERFRPATRVESAQTRARLEIPRGAPVIAFAARFDAMKDPELFLRAVAAHQRRRPDTYYVLCGAGMIGENLSLRDMLDRICDRAPDLRRRVRLLGIVDDIPAVYGGADIVALTSAYGEASPLCLLEGAACGATPVTTDVGDAARRVSGLGRVTTRDPDEIATTWEHVLGARAELRAAALAARPRLDRAHMIDEYAAITRGLVQPRRVAA
ncbi:glycosyltransferase family 4 protein [Microbacterium hibisci]|uniref:glycosyltransferase family 4 protein n=1 Tax=Microbacterium hibisci TaxID=2036000 RepID=UPI0019427B33|nr:glycosyltransferase family 4 protein [Microbacterium hibisci]